MYISIVMYSGSFNSKRLHVAFIFLTT